MKTVFKKTLIIIFLAFILNHSHAQIKSYSITVWNLQGEQVFDASISVWKKNKQEQLTNFPCEIKMNIGIYNINCPCTVQDLCDSTSFLKIEYANYETTSMPLFMVKPGEKILIGNQGVNYYSRVRFSLNGYKGIYKIPYTNSSDRIVIALTNYGRKHIEKVQKLLDDNGMELVDKNLYRECGILVKKKNGNQFSSNKCKELEVLRKNRKMILYAGPCINNYTNALTNYIIVRVNYSDRKKIKAFSKTNELKIIKSHGVEDRNGDGKYDFYAFLIEAKKDVGSDINIIAKDVLNNSLVSQCDIFLFCSNPSDLDLFPSSGRKSKGNFNEYDAHINRKNKQ